MGIITEYNPGLALKDISEYKKGNRKIEECIPVKLQINHVYSFLKKGQRLYWFHGEIPLLKTKGEGNLSKPKASIIILEATHFLYKSEIYTKGKYKVIEIFNDNKIHFDGFSKV
jgi:hypothetical protein